MDTRQRQRLMIRVITMTFLLVFIGLPLAAYQYYRSNTYPASALTLANYEYPEYSPSCSGVHRPSSSPSSRPSSSGSAGTTNDLKTLKGYRYNVKTPLNYQDTYAHPLLVVYAPSVSGRLMEKYVGLTHEATKAGFVIVYVDGQRMSLSSIAELGTVSSEVMKQWCIDETRVFLTGHSDGGTIATALAFLDDTPVRLAGIAPSAAGITGKELLDYQCPAPLSVMVMHNEGDTHFPGFGEKAAKWWASCNQCDESPVAMGITGACVKYENCSSGVETLYCEVKEGSHMTWPRLNPIMLQLFKRSPSARL